MNETCEKIWKLALPYQDKRDDTGHGRIVTAFAEELLQKEKGDAMVVVPAAILHDIGWSQIPRDELMQLFNYMPGSGEEKELRLRHQVEGVRLAEKILKEANYSKEYVDEILEIISEHDTRKGFLNTNDTLMRDADKLWMFSKEGFKADLDRRKLSAKEWSVYLEQVIDEKLFTDSAKHIAKRELVLRLKE